MKESVTLSNNGKDDQQSYHTIVEENSDDKMSNKSVQDFLDGLTDAPVEQLNGLLEADYRPPNFDKEESKETLQPCESGLED